VLETVSRPQAHCWALRPLICGPTRTFTDLGGDSLSALTFANAAARDLRHRLRWASSSPSHELHVLADYIEAERTSGLKTAHLRDGARPRSTEVHARDSALDKFIKRRQHAGRRPYAATPARRVRPCVDRRERIPGALLALEWLERLSFVGGTLFALVRAKDDAAARERLTRPSTAAIRICCGTTGTGRRSSDSSRRQKRTEPRPGSQTCSGGRPRSI